jgi:hypothetical protein
MMPPIQKLETLKKKYDLIEKILEHLFSMYHMVTLQRRQTVNRNFQVIHLKSGQDIYLSIKNKMVLLRVCKASSNIFTMKKFGVMGILC